MKWGHYNRHQGNSEDHKDIHPKSIFQQTGKPQRNR